MRDRKNHFLKGNKDMKYIKAALTGKGRALLKKKDKSYSIVLLAYTPPYSTEKENDHLIGNLTNVYMDYLSRIEADTQEEEKEVAKDEHGAKD